MNGIDPIFDELSKQAVVLARHGENALFPGDHADGDRMGAALAHLFELPNKIDIGAADYLTVQRNYDNWWIVGLIVPLAVVSVLAVTVALRGTGTPFRLSRLGKNSRRGAGEEGRRP